MIIYICAFTNSGREVAEEIAEVMPAHISRFFEVGDSLSKWVKDGFDIRAPFIFICASGIAVRSIAPYVTNKLVDSPVVVMDEKKEFVIPLLSGHIGGANELAYTLADLLGATPVITTATDINKKFAVDNWAKENGLRIYNKDGIGKISSMILENEPVKLLIQTNVKLDLISLPADVKIVNCGGEDANIVDRGGKNVNIVDCGGETVNIVDCGGETVEDCATTDADIIVSDNIQNASKCKLLLVPQRICIGIGCRKDTPATIIEEKVNETLAELASCDLESELHEDNDITLGKSYLHGNLYDNIYGIASIDLKAKEYGIVEFAQKNGVKFVTFSAEELKAVKGDFTESEFVEKTTGVANVCERAAVKLAGADGRLVVSKHASDGVTVAIAVRYQE